MTIEFSPSLEHIQRSGKPSKDYLRHKVDEALGKTHEKHFKRGSHRRLAQFDEKQKKIRQATALVQSSGFPTEHVYGSGPGGRLDYLMRRLESRIKDGDQRVEDSPDARPFSNLSMELEERYHVRKQRLNKQKRNLPVYENPNQVYKKICEELEQVNAEFLKEKDSLLAKFIRAGIKKQALDTKKDLETRNDLRSKFYNNPLNIKLGKENDSLTDNPLQLSVPISDYGEIKSHLGRHLQIDISHPNEGVFMKQLFERSNKNNGVSQIEFLSQFLFPDKKGEDLRIFYPKKNTMPKKDALLLGKEVPEPRLKSFDQSDEYKTEAMTAKQVFELFETGIEEVPIVLVKDRVGNVLLELTFSYISSHELGLINLRMPEQKNKNRLLGRFNRWVDSLQSN